MSPSVKRTTQTSKSGESFAFKAKLHSVAITRQFLLESNNIKQPHARHYDIIQPMVFKKFVSNTFNYSGVSKTKTMKTYTPNLYQYIQIAFHP